MKNEIVIRNKNRITQTLNDTHKREKGEGITSPIRKQGFRAS